MANYINLSEKVATKIATEKLNGTFMRLAFNEQNAVRRVDNPHDNSTVIRNAFVRDVDKILNCPFYNRYADKTQVFSFYKNDDIARRSLHVQLVSRIARTIGSALNLNVDLIEAIALGHDLGHTPFGHFGESVLSKISQEKTGKCFAHNVHSVRVVDKIFPLNVTLQTLDGIACHNGELELSEYAPKQGLTFDEFDGYIASCYEDSNNVLKLTPSTLEGCVVRICDIIAYLGKDRDDAAKSNLLIEPFADYGIGTKNAEIINNLTVSIIENSYGKPFIKMDEKAFKALSASKKANYSEIYNLSISQKQKDALTKMINKLYGELYSHLVSGKTTSPVFTHHINYLEKPYYKRQTPYSETDKHQIVIDYIASMTDDYFIELYNHLFPNDTTEITYHGYFE